MSIIASLLLNCSKQASDDMGCGGCGSDGTPQSCRQGHAVRFALMRRATHATPARAARPLCPAAAALAAACLTQPATLRSLLTVGSQVRPPTPSPDPTSNPSMLCHAAQSRRDRVAAKFVEAEFEKCDRLMEVYLRYEGRVAAEEAR